MTMAYFLKNSLMIWKYDKSSLKLTGILQKLHLIENYKLYIMKKGISLIVLVITIIVMIIIAGAIILALNSSNVTTKPQS